jgi:hypothetical protein
VSDVSEEHVTSIIKVKEQAKHESGRQQELKITDPTSRQTGRPTPTKHVPKNN